MEGSGSGPFGGTATELRGRTVVKKIIDDDRSPCRYSEPSTPDVRNRSANQ